MVFQKSSLLPPAFGALAEYVATFWAESISEENPSMCSTCSEEGARESVPVQKVFEI